MTASEESLFCQWESWMRRWILNLEVFALEDSGVAQYVPRAKEEVAMARARILSGAAKLIRCPNEDGRGHDGIAVYELPN